MPQHVPGSSPKAYIRNVNFVALTTVTKFDVRLRQGHVLTERGQIAVFRRNVLDKAGLTDVKIEARLKVRIRNKEGNLTVTKIMAVDGKVVPTGK
ncbi:hypothetical protein HY971_04800 [Candidatus Kaiserbacteria bacterium]|nr:hypothetical protein [Candidatus Kaiserbacteria bacterium]